MANSKTQKFGEIWYMIKVLSQFTEKTLDNRTATGKSTGTDARINSKVFRVPNIRGEMQRQERGEETAQATEANPSSSLYDMGMGKTLTMA